MSLGFEVVYFVLREEVGESLLMHCYTECENHRGHVAILEISFSFIALRVVKTSLFLSPNFDRLDLISYSSTSDPIQRSRNRGGITLESIISNTLASLLLEMFRLEYTIVILIAKGKEG